MGLRPLILVSADAVEGGFHSNRGATRQREQLSYCDEIRGKKGGFSV